MTEKEPGSGYRESNSTADKVLAILGLFDDERLTISAPEVASALGVAKSTAYRYIESLTSSYFLEEAGPGRFQLGVRNLQLARLAGRGIGLAEVARPRMKELAARFHLTVLLSRRVGDSIVVIENQEWEGQYVRLWYGSGARLPVNAGASAHVLLAWLPEQKAREILLSQPLERLAENSFTDVDELILHLRSVREQGFCVARGETDDETMGIAVPIIGVQGEVLAALSVVGMRSRVPDVMHGEIVEALRVAASATRHALGLSYEVAS
jgi:DNA-binding IclR family transcriptional regulator